MGSFTEKRISFFEVLSYGIGSFGGSVALIFVTTFLMYYCTDSAGLSAGIVGTLILIAKLLDGVSDIFMGYLINRTHSRIGKARFWIILCALPLGLTEFLLFYIPSFITGAGRYVWLFVFYVLQTAVFYTMWSVSTQAILSFCTTRSQDRLRMQSSWTIFNVLPAILLSFTGQMIAENIGWSLTAFIMGCLTFAGVLFAGLVIKEIPEAVLQQESMVKTETAGFLPAVRLLITNKYFWLLMGLNLAIYIYTGIQGSTAVYYCNYVLNDPGAFGWLYLALYGPLVAFAGFMPKIIEKVGVKRINVIGAVFAVATGSIVFIRPQSLVVVAIALFLMTVGGLPSYVTVVPLVSELSENIKIRKQKDISSMCYACTSAGQKLGMGLGTALAGILLDLVGYDGMAAVQTAGTIAGVKYIFIAPPVIAWAVMILLYYLLDVTEVNQKLREEIR